LLAAAKEFNLQAKLGDGLVAKAIQYHEILGVRHSVFLIGNPGTAKSAIWKTLARAYNIGGYTGKE
jgi:dynein heavy chain